MEAAKTSLYRKLEQLQWLLHRRHMRAHMASGPRSDPTRGQGRIIAILKLQDGISTKDLSFLLGIRVSSLNELLAKMEKSGYIKREPSEADRRVMLVKLTEKGTQEEQRTQSPVDVFDCLSAEELGTFAALLDKIIDSQAASFEKEADEEEKRWWQHGGRERMGKEMFDLFADMLRGGHHHHGGDSAWEGFAHGDFGRHHTSPQGASAPGPFPEGPDNKDEENE